MSRSLNLWGRLNTRFTRVRQRLEAVRFERPWQNALYEFGLFGFKQGWACLFGALLLVLLLGTHFWYPQGAALSRYDFLTLAALSIQILMLSLRLETWEEARVILIFHVVGTAMEVFKTAVGSWIYPEEGLLRIAGVPLFSGFMYAAVGSYIARVWRIFDFRFSHYPSPWLTYALAALIYINFFTHHFLPDIRLALFGGAALLFRRTTIWFKPHRAHRRMPLLLGLGLVALFIWFAENIGTFARAWTYPEQASGWTMVKPEKLGAWFLLMMISFVLVSTVSRPKPLNPSPPP